MKHDNNILILEILFTGKLVTKKFLMLLVQKASTLKNPFASAKSDESSVEFNALFKLTSKHVTAHGSERQNVKLAAELLSHTTAVNLRRHFGEYEEACLLAEIIETVNSWFDVMNSYSLTQNVTSKKCYGVELEQQNKILDKMADLIKEIRVLTNHCLPAEPGLKVINILSKNAKCLIYSDFSAVPESDLDIYRVNEKTADGSSQISRHGPEFPNDV